MALTLLALLGGASIGREGPTVHVGAGLMYCRSGRRFGFNDPKALSRFVLAGGGAGIAAAFNTPLAGVVFAIEELAGTFEHRFSGIVLTAVIFAGVVSLGVLGDYAYFGQVTGSLAARPGLDRSPPVRHLRGPRWRTLRAPDPARRARPARDARSACGSVRRSVSPAACGLALAAVGLLSGNSIYGTGYEQAHALVQATNDAPAALRPAQARRQYRCPTGPAYPAASSRPRSRSGRAWATPSSVMLDSSNPAGSLSCSAWPRSSPA